ncbi:very long chain fatty acid elongase 4-like isoform X1 [Amphiura filiformis]|uniref:very long chain fatty acid elongase 4-like isoform X1 n=1 Tax=Amphiura filiformis TaxID=82378 RepID=UPI003B2186CC
METVNSVVTKVQDFATWADSVKDPRTQEWPLVASPFPLLALVALYLFVVWYGPKVMSGYRPLNLKYLMILYNAGLVALSAYMCVEFFMVSFMNPKFNVYCEPVDYSDDPMAVRLAAVAWWFYISKILEFLDTVIFVLRKKDEQISFLHVYHHTTMPCLWWIGVHWIPGGASYFGGMINSFVHVIMYGYYALTALGPAVRPYLWWKRYLTSIQLVQFVVAMSQCVLVLCLDCGFPRPFVWALMAYAFSHLLLFGNFFHKTYIVNGVDKKSQQRGRVEETHT